ncbi:MAG TPA: methyltransferase, partial [Pseudonocardiaceae bacterium]|nr:methyltransferase [Pseudonocardiaceae bacterium]
MTTPNDMTDIPATAPPPVQMMQLLYGSLVPHLVTVVGVADLVADQPRPVAELAESTGTNPDALYRALRTLAGQGVFTEVTPRTFGPTPLEATLRTGGSGSLRNYARYWGLPEWQRAFAELGYSVRTGRSAFAHVHGIDWWSHLATNPQQDALFNDVMGYLARQLHAAAIEAYDLSDVRRLVGCWRRARPLGVHDHA